MVQKPLRVIGLDIGSTHNGVAIIEYGTRKLLHTETCTRDRLILNVERLRPEEVMMVGVEQFALYPWAAKAQAWNTLENVQLIGVVKYILEKNGIDFIELRPVDTKKIYSHIRLKQLGYIIKSDANSHQRDALSVALLAHDRMKK